MACTLASQSLSRMLLVQHLGHRTMGMRIMRTEHFRELVVRRINGQQQRQVLQRSQRADGIAAAVHVLVYNIHS